MGMNDSASYVDILLWLAEVTVPKVLHALCLKRSAAIFEDVSRVNRGIHEAPTVHLLKVDKVFGWLKSRGKNPAEETRKERLRDQLKIYLG
jgi:hypothetical protein